MSRAATLLAALLLGLLVGAATVVVPGAAPGPTAGPGDTGPTDTGPTDTGEAHAPSATAPPAAEIPEPDTGLLLAWTAGGLPEDVGETIRSLAAVESAVVVAGDRADLVAATTADGAPATDLDDGWVVPLDAIAADPATFAAHVDRPAELAGLRPGRAILGATSAELREVGAGATLTLAPDVTVTVTAVVDDVTVGGAEILLHPRDAAAAGVATRRYVLLHHRGDRADLETDIRAAVADRPVRIRAPGETPYLRHGDAVLPQAQIKARFGEFAYRPSGAGREFTIDAGWVAEHIVTATVPILGRVTCHGAVIPTLRDALGDLADRGLSHLVDPAQYAGCFAARLTATGELPSRHAWGVAVDLNQDVNPTGSGSGQDPRLVEILGEAGFAWGGAWLVPDPMHFEYVRPGWPSVPKARPESPGG